MVEEIMQVRRGEDKWGDQKYLLMPLLLLEKLISHFTPHGQTLLLAKNVNSNIMQSTYPK